MPVQFQPEDLEAQMQIKDVFDPQWLLNPAKVSLRQLSRAAKCKRIIELSKNTDEYFPAKNRI